MCHEKIQSDYKPHYKHFSGMLLINLLFLFLIFMRVVQVANPIPRGFRLWLETVDQWQSLVLDKKKKKK